MGQTNCRRPRCGRNRRPDPTQIWVLRSARRQTASVDLGNSDLFFHWRIRGNGSGDRVCWINFSRNRSCAHSNVACNNRRSSLTDSPYNRSRSSASLSQYAARVQIQIPHVCWRMDCFCFRGLRNSRIDRARAWYPVQLRWRDRSVSKDFRASPRHRFGVLGSFARHLHRSFARRHCDSRMVFASRAFANSFRQCGIGVGYRSAGAARSPCRAAQRPWISRRSDRDSALDLA